MSGTALRWGAWLCVFTPGLAWGCPACALRGSGGKVGWAIAAGIALPFTVAGVVGFAVVRQLKRRSP